MALELASTPFEWKLGERMAMEDLSRPVAERTCVFLTGGTGYIGSHTARLLMHLGYRVRAGVRNPKSPWSKWLQDLNGQYPGELSLVECSLDEPEQWAAAVKGASQVIHCATRTRSSQLNKVVETHDMFESSTTGLVDLLNACKADGGVKRVSFCGSVVATNEEGLGEERAQEEVRLFRVDENGWTPVDLALANGSHPYSVSKTKVEMAFWKWARRNPGAMEMVAVLPCLTIGPIINGRYCSSLDTIVLFTCDDMPCADVEMLWVDVRDVADAMVASIQKPAEMVDGQRYPVANAVLPMIGNQRYCHDWFHRNGHPEYGLKWGLTRIPDPMIVVLKTLYQDFKKFLAPMIEVSKFKDTRKTERDLNIIYFPLDVSISDSLESVFKYDLMPPPKGRGFITPKVVSYATWLGIGAVGYKLIQSKL